MIVTTVPQQWTALQRLPLDQRILAMPAEVCELVHQANLASGLAALPCAVEPDAQLRADLQAALAGMPDQVRELVDPLLLGICLGRDLGSSGVTDIVVDPADGSILGCIVLLDVDSFAGHTANSWASWKENLPFLDQGGVSLDATIAKAEQDTHAGALQFLLLHEFGHVLSADGSFLPRWWEPVAQLADDARFAYLDLSWELGPLQRFVPRPHLDFALRGAVDYYGNNKLDNEAILDAYAGLEASDFPSLYGATNPYDDFAECFATWVHSEMLGRPYQLRVDFDGVPQAYLENFWASPRSARKRAFMHALFALAPSAANAGEVRAVA